MFISEHSELLLVESIQRHRCVCVCVCVCGTQEKRVFTFGHVEQRGVLKRRHVKCIFVFVCVFVCVFLCLLAPHAEGKLKVSKFFIKQHYQCNALCFVEKTAVNERRNRCVCVCMCAFLSSTVDWTLEKGTKSVRN